MSRRIALTFALLLTVMVVGPAQALGGGCHVTSPSSAGKGKGDLTVRIAECDYSPRVVYVEPGSTVEWVNEDMFAHTVTGRSMGISGATELSSGDSTGPIAFNKTGVFPYSCILHPGMVGAVVVGDLDELRADAKTLDSEMLGAAADTSGTPPSDGRGSSTMAIGLGVLVAAMVAGGGFLLWRRLHGPVAPEDGSALQH